MQAGNVTRMPHLNYLGSILCYQGLRFMYGIYDLFTLRQAMDVKQNTFNIYSDDYSQADVNFIL
jgi:hypothetical protein